MASQAPISYRKLCYEAKLRRMEVLLFLEPKSGGMELSVVKKIGDKSSLVASEPMPNIEGLVPASNCLLGVLASSANR